MTEFSQFVTYSQIAVFNNDLDNPFNDWADQHVQQGFSWREESVSFRTLEEDGDLEISLLILDKFSPSPDSQRTISVPFFCNKVGKIDIATITETRTFELPSGHYQIIFETGSADTNSWCRLSMIRDGQMEPSVEIVDAALSPAYPLLMTAFAAK